MEGILCGQIQKNTYGNINNKNLAVTFIIGSHNQVETNTLHILDSSGYKC